MIRVEFAMTREQAEEFLETIDSQRFEGDDRFEIETKFSWESAETLRKDVRDQLAVLEDAEAESDAHTAA